MKKQIFYFLSCLLVISFSHSLKAQTTTKANLKKVLHLKFKEGKASEGIEIGKNYYSKAYAQAGYPTEVFEIKESDSEWDAIIVIPLKGGLKELDMMHPDIVMKKMVQLAGGEEELQLIKDRFASMVAKQRMDLAELEEFSSEANNR